jgi:5,10-methylenetetrahydromethanopterin reductase
MQIGLGVQGNLPVTSYAELGQAAERYGFDSIGVFGDLWYLPPIVPLTLIAAHTSQIRLGPSCLNPYTLAPSEIVGQVAALDALSGGRAFLGLARGAWLDAVGIEQQRPLSAVRDTIGIVRQLLAGEGRALSGRAFTLAPGQRLKYEVQRADVPIMVGTWSPKMTALAGELADEVKIGASANPAVVRQVRSWLAPGLVAAGRAAEDVGVIIGVTTVVDEDGDAARAYARRGVAPYFEVVAAMDPTANLEPELIGRISDLVRAGRLDDAGALISDDVLRCFAFAGTPDEVADHASELYEAGATRVEFNSPHGLDEPGGLRLLGERVLPLLRR